MHYTFKNASLRDLFEDDSKFKSKYGDRALRNRDRRPTELANSENVAELLRLGSKGPGRWHVLDNRNGGSNEGKISGDLTGKLRILLSPPDSAFGKTAEVEIVEIQDTHKK